MNTNEVLVVYRSTVDCLSLTPQIIRGGKEGVVY